jgi:hypothetical protein
LSLSWGNVAVGELILVLIERSLNPLPHEMGHLRSGLIKCGLNVAAMIYGTINPTSIGNLRYKNNWVMVDSKRQSIKKKEQRVPASRLVSSYFVRSFLVSIFFLSLCRGDIVMNQISEITTPSTFF